MLKHPFEQLLGESPYQSPADMGVNMAGTRISDDEMCQEAPRQGTIRRYFKALVAEHRDRSEPIQSGRITLLMSKS